MWNWLNPGISSGNQSSFWLSSHHEELQVLRQPSGVV